jgi:pyruvate formate lyase activating enzyme
MKILGFIETSLVDWDKKVASVIFLGGCNFKCPFCQNYPLVKEAKELKELEWDTIKKKLVKKRKWIDGVVVTGGEPMMHPEIFGLLIKLKELGFKTKVDTNGSFPYPLKEAIELGLVDYAAMDIKAVLDKRYYKAAGRKVWFIVLERTIRLLKECGTDYEFRTTMVPGIVEPEDLIEIAKKIAPVKKYAIQQFAPKNTRLARYRNKKPFTKEDIEKFILPLKKYIAEVQLRGF